MVVAAIGSRVASSAPRTVTFVAVADAYVQAKGNERVLSGRSKEPPKPATDEKSNKKDDKSDNSDKGKPGDDDDDDKGGGKDGKWLRVDLQPLQVSYLRFRVHGIDGGLRRATLRLHAESASRIGFDVRPVASDSWSESKLTFRNAPPYGAVIARSGPFAKRSWVEIDVSSVVRSTGAYSFALTARSKGKIKLASRETGSTAPQLVVEANTAPTARDDAAQTDEDTELVLQGSTLTANDTDPDGDALTVTAVSSSADTHGTVSLSSGVVRYRPAADYNGPAAFGYTISDGHGGTASARVAVTVRPVNDAPVASPGSATTDEDTPVTVTLVATDVDGDALTYELVTGPAKGTLSALAGIAGNEVTYTPNADANGPDSFTFRASDASAQSNTATVSLTVRPVNDGPTAADDEAATDEDTPLELASAALLANDSDPDGDTLTVTAVSSTADTHGAVTLLAGGVVRYEPAAGYNGPASFGYSISDGHGGSSSATVTVTVRPVNDAPVAAPGSASTNEDVPVKITLAASDGDGDLLAFAIVTGPTRGTLSAVLGDEVVYTPNANVSGTDSFTFKANDGTADSNVATVSITVREVNQAPVALGADVTVASGVAKEIALQASDPDGDSLTRMIVNAPSHGTLGAVGETVVYTPAAGYTGPDQFTFKANDGRLDSNVATVSITVILNDPQPSFPIRAAFYYPWFPEAWSQLGLNPYTKYTPSLGYYDSGSASVIRSHIEAMQYGNIAAGIASWWGPGHNTDTRFPALLQGAAGTGFRWAAYHEGESQGDPTVEQLRADLTYLRDQYASDPSYLRIGGKFVVFVYGGEGETCATVDRWKAANTVGAHVVLRVFSGYRSCAAQPNGWHQYAPANAIDRQIGFATTISPGFHLASDAAPRLGRDVVRWRQNIREMIAAGEPWQLVTSFNEWGEGTSVENAFQWPSGSGYGDYLDALHDNGAEPAPSTVLLAAGDVASCTRTGDEATALLLGLQPAAKVALLGDVAYENGTVDEFNNCYDPSWGKAAKDRTYPSVGNHEYNTAGAVPYFNYFGSIAGDPAKGYYSYDLGTWHVVVVNSNCSKLPGGCARDSEQEKWVREDLALNPSICTLAYWHHPRFSSGTSHGSHPQMQPIFQAFYEAGGDLVLTGHEHNVEIFGPQTATGAPDLEHGVRQFVVGTGGRDSLYPFGPPLPNSEVREANVLGVLELTLGAFGYEWVFLPIGGQSFTTSGSATCHADGGAPLPTVDTVAPTVPTNLKATANGSRRVDLSWSPSTDDFGVKDHRIYRNGQPLATSSTTTYSDTSVVPEQTYSYTVAARDALNESAQSEPAVITTGPATSTETFVVAADTFVRADQPAASFGNAATLEVDGEPLKKILLRFDLTGLTGRTVTKATLRLFCVDSSSVGGNFSLVADNSWSESTVTWDTAPAAGAVFTSLGSVAAGNWYAVDVTSVVTGDGPLSLQIASAAANGADYRSSEGDAALGPHLLVEATS